MQTPDEADRLLEMQRLGNTDSGNKETDEIEDKMLHILELLNKILLKKNDEIFNHYVSIAYDSVDEALARLRVLRK